MLSRISDEGEWRGRLRFDPFLIALAAAMAASGALLLILGSRLPFFQDDWQLLLFRDDLTVDAFLAPHNDHIVLLPAAIYKLLLAIFGMDSTMPYRVVAVGLFLLSCGLLFDYVRRRNGEWVALLATCLVLFLGAAWEDLLWAFQMGFFGAIAFGMVAFRALEREDHKGDLIACLALVVSIAFTSLGIPFAIGAGVALLLSPRPLLPRVWVVAIPAVLWIAWWSGWGREASASLSFDNLITTPEFVLDSLIAGLASLAAVSEPVNDGALLGHAIGFGLLALVGALAALRFRRLGKPPRWFWVALAAGVAFWALTGINQIPGREPHASRYQLPNAFFLIMVLSNLLVGVRLRRPLLLGASVLCAAAVAAGVLQLRDGYRDVLLPAGQEAVARMAAVESAGGRGDPGYELALDLGGYWLIEAGAYREAADSHGSPAPDLEEVASFAPNARAAFDAALAGLLGARAVPDPGAAVGGCDSPLRLTASTGLREAGRTLIVGNPGRGPRLISLGLQGGADPDHAALGLTPEAPAVVGIVAAGKAVRLRLPPTGTERPWLVGTNRGRPLLACPRG